MGDGGGWMFSAIPGKSISRIRSFSNVDNSDDVSIPSRITGSSKQYIEKVRTF